MKKITSLLLVVAMITLLFASCSGPAKVKVNDVKVDNEIYTYFEDGLDDSLSKSEKEDAIKKLIEVPMDENKSIPHDFEGKFGSANVLLKRAPGGTGIIAGGPARAVLELAGYKNIRTKSLGSNNKQNVVLATIAGLAALKSPEEVAKKRGKSVEEILG